MRRYFLVGVVAAGGLLAVAASQGPVAKPLMEPGRRYVVLMPSDVKRTVEVVDNLSGGWVRAKYASSTDNTERVITLNLAQVVYFHPDTKSD